MKHTCPLLLKTDNLLSLNRIDSDPNLQTCLIGRNGKISKEKNDIGEVGKVQTNTWRRNRQISAILIVREAELLY